MKTNPLHDLRRRRLSAYRDQIMHGEGITARAFAKRAGKPESQITDILSGRKSFGEAVAHAIEDGLGLPRGYLDIEEDESGQRATLIAISPILKSVVPEIPWDKVAEVCELGSIREEDQLAAHPCSVEHGPNTFALRIAGDMYLPAYRDGEVIFVDPDIEPMHEDDVVATMDDGRVLLRRLQITPEGHYLLSVTSSFPDRPRQAGNDATVRGVVIASQVDRRGTRR